MERPIHLLALFLSLATFGCVPPETLWYADLDGDGFGDPATESTVEISGYIHYPHDCNDNDSTVNPDAIEVVDGIDNDCDGISDQKIVFVSSVAYPSIMQGMVGGDTRCQGLADAAAFAAFPDIVPKQLKFKAWLSNANASAADRFEHSLVPYVLSDAVTVVAEDWDHLVSTVALNNPIDLTELGTPPDNSLNTDGYSVWTGTRSDGTSLAGLHHCENWTKNDSSVTAIVGRYDVTDRKWTEQPSRSCELKEYFLYCFQQ